MNKYEKCLNKTRKRDQSTTIVILTHNNQESILYTLKKILETSKRHKSITKIIVIDQKSTDHTQEIIIKLMTTTKKEIITLITTHEQNINKIMKKILPHLTTNNTIFIEPTLYTYPRQITQITETLKKAHIIIPDRFHKHTHAVWNNNIESKKIQQQNNELIKKHKIKIRDPTNAFRAYKTHILTLLIQNAHNNQNFWIQTMQKAEELQLITIQLPIEYNTKKTEVYKGYSFDYKMFLRNH